MNFMSKLTIRLISILSVLTVLSWVTVKAASPIVHIAEKHESIYSIAHRYGYSVDELVRMNPSLRNGVKAGARILIPRGDLSVNQPQEATQSTPKAAEPNIAGNDVVDAEQPVITVDNVLTNDTLTYEDETLTAEVASINIAVLLPLQTQRDTPTRQAQNYTDFVRGFLMGIDTLRNDESLPQVHLNIYDTHESIDTVKALLDNPAVSNANYIIVSDNADQIEAAANTADSSGSTVLNLFAVRNDAQHRHKSVVQTNIPHELMYEKAISRFINKYSGYIPVIIDELHPETTPDKAKFTEMLISALADRGINYRKISYTESLSADSLAWLNPDLNYVFVPSSSTRSAVSAILPSLLQARSGSALGLGSVTLFGYPEWVIFPQDLTRKLHELDATIYSRFGSNPNGYRTRTFASNFRSHYGAPMISSAPSYALLGYDTAIWLIDNADPMQQPFSGLQNSFRFSSSENNDTNTNDAGNVNDALYFITFQSTGLIDNNTDI